ncbi:CAP domain-containing protein [Bosea sp. (in: a-proteobacteria)]|uniref:CAP domain-containing protein n=1 Tax=Bosea sp. (in: a-proteobacteria) TaxID=1871050 RepID=UPI0026071BB4|nr:CAP domain-containing protein [Bosea sp. (in: a-proteobacteria)]MCO5091148.1 CAP domain-containing protein [Bosea sp. (in: a-proteobacteria)]
MKNALVLALAATLLAGCAGEPRREGALDPRMVEKLNAVTLDPAEAGRILNAYRAGHGLGPLRPDPRLMAMAQRQADAMVKANALSHDAGGSFTARVEAAGIDSAHVAENLGGGYFSTAEAFDGWRKSPGHDANLRLPNATRYGIALSKDPRTSYRAWWVLTVAAEPEIRREMAAEGAGPIVGFGNDPRPAR